MTKVLQLATMGHLKLSQDGMPLIGLVSAKAQALLCYLAVTGRAHSRQALAGLLWSELPEADARRNLRGVIMRLRQYVELYLQITHQTLQFNPESAYWLDVEVLSNLTQTNGDVNASQLRDAVALYRGEFLEDFSVRDAPMFEEWLTLQRSRLRDLMLRAYFSLGMAYTAQGLYEDAALFLQRLLVLNPVQEDAHRQLMLVLALSGQRTAALSHFEQCRQILWAELGVEPAPETAVLLEQIRAGRIEGQTHTVIHFPPPPTVLPPPFIAGPPITYPARFFGRERELKRLFNLLKRLPLQNAAIVGPRRSGKTSLLHYLQTITTTPPTHLRKGQRTDWLLQPDRYRWIFVDFQDPRLGDQTGLLRYLLTQMEFPVPTPCDLDQFLDVVSDQLQNPTIILFDEIDVALARYPTLDNAFWESLRSLATNQVGGNLGFILASAKRPEILAQHSGYGSPFFNIFGYTATLGPLSEGEAQALIQSAPIPFSTEDIAWILAESGRWPMPLEILCRERLLALEDGEIDDSWREDALHQIAPFQYE